VNFLRIASRKRCATRPKKPLKRRKEEKKKRESQFFTTPGYQDGFLPLVSVTTLAFLVPEGANDKRKQKGIP
jgi:hypothetical protein